MTGPSIVSAPGQEDWVEQALLAELRATAPQGVNDSITLIAQDGANRVGGLHGATSYGWLLIKTLWVDPTHRRRGLGRQLLDHAFAEARQRGCHSAWLDTSNPAAARFYQALGFEPFGRLANTPTQSPPGHCRWFLWHTLQ
ncbi:GNAT family N-acetyltransferase [Ruegeria arenilitoris]|uniref:GNAT family N-acetyltransferase n=1 Tax=Ruegeria arenilitoris TaxID=1173585 RepID=UPI00147BB8F7|nr:GNAT family N-acetyltransferase [Ruegeria arenilitoris]